jgi:1,6-anhydro-N-acetylmuramate kinase
MTQIIGLMSGTSKDGLDIIQTFIDQYDDIQTSALLVSRIIDHNNSFIDSSKYIPV